MVVSTAAGAHAQAIDWTKIDGIFARTTAVSGAVNRASHHSLAAV